MDLAATLERLVPAASYAGSLTGNTQTDWQNVTWQDDRGQPTWNQLVAEWPAVRRQRLMTAVNATTSAGIAAGYTYADKTFSASANHQTWSLGMTLGIAAGRDFTGTVVPTIDDADGHTITDNADAAAMAAACQNFVAAWLASGSALKKIIAESSDEDLDNFVDPRTPGTTPTP